MAKETAKCPMCGTKLKMMNGQMTCKKCGYYIRIQSEQTGTANGSAYSSSQQSGYNTASGQTGYQTTGGYSASGSQSTGSYSSRQQSGYQSTGSYNAGQQSGASRPSGSGSYKPPKNSGDTNAAVTIVTVVSIGVISLAAITGLVLFRTGALNNLFSGNSRNNSSSDHQMANSSAAGPDDSQSTSQGTSSEDSASGSFSSARLPQSEFFQLVAEAIWEEPWQEISPETYATLTALQINRDDKIIYYQLSNGDTQTLTYQSDIGMQLSDFASFPGLEWISIDDDLEKGDLKGLDYLYAVYAENTFEELASIIPHPENITDLGVYDSIFKRNLSGIESFPNLLYLDLEYESVEDISALAQFPELLGLRLADCDDVNDYSPLMNLTNLEELSIQSSQLKSIDFIRQMPNLVSFSIEDTKVTNVSALEACPGLTWLSLVDNTEISDYSIIGQLTQLTQLELELNYGGTLPSLANMPQLEWLSVKYAGDLTPLKDATNVTYLALEDCSGWEFSSITAMQGLTTLIINDFSSYVDSLEPLMHLPNLTALSLEDTSIFGNIEEIFGIPTLQYLYLDDCQVGLDFNNLPYNETLEVLSLDDITILNDPTYNNGDKVNLAEHYDMFEHFPNLTELYLASLNLDSIDFVENLPMLQYLASLNLDSIDFVENLPLLQYLDISNNNVTSLKPLENLSDFRVVWCGRNTILENLPDDSPISVIMEDR